MTHAPNKTALFTSKSDTFPHAPHVLDAVCQVGAIDFEILPCILQQKRRDVPDSRTLSPAMASQRPGLDTSPTEESPSSTLLWTCAQ